MTPCKTCCKLFMSPLTCIPVLGDVCEQCFEKLSKPVIQCGVITVMPIVELCELTQREFDGRREKMLSQARVICEGE